MRAKQEKILKIVITAVMVILGLICIYPFIFMLSSSFKPSGDVLSTPLQIIPSNFTMMNFETLFNNEFYDFFQWLRRSSVLNSSQRLHMRLQRLFPPPGRLRRRGEASR